MSARDVGHRGTRTTFLDMNEDELRDLVRKLRKEKRRLKDRLKQAKASPEFFEADGNRGGSLIRIEKVFERDFKTVKEGMVRLTVGESCVFTCRDLEISVVGLAAVLTQAYDIGFQKVVDAYLAKGGGSPSISVKHDLPPKETP
ncbi:hypothetical protein JYP52_21490 [Nitratireductor aquibiodomus]|uniref:hypothetical protein n=1 Tax=Nitratireductor aquibiodomus TaxID=204799 RepID=UPI0019D3373D|nr:hypothetical protein [Nitratireductor aquibiodomus]MBN7763716.1 hypothetical protein [Nitratireductor aquibiodomus]